MEKQAAGAQIALMLHMHQPDYRDPSSGCPGMPWVRLHAVRGYTDVASLVLQTGAPVTINVVPSLLEQLAYYTAGGSDTWADLSRIPAEDLRPEQAAFVRDHFVHGHPAMRAASPRYRELASRASELVHPGDLRDLQVWSNLAWMGFTARKGHFVRGLMEQDRGFDHGQLLALMDLQAELVAGVLPLWRRLPFVSTSPRCHPILPLLVDFAHARRSLPQQPEHTGVDFAWPDDALRQLVEARAHVGQALGRAPNGLWPSEGALSPEVMKLAEKAGFTWVAADGGLLGRSRRDGPPVVHRPWRCAAGGPTLLFRHQGLSDRVGFDYHQVPGWRAAADLLEGAADVLRQARATEGVVPIILDGENPWEAYPDAGEGFLRALFDSGRLLSMDAAAARPLAGRIESLHTGSWINGDLQIWAGDPEDWAAWRQLALVRAAYEEAGRPEAAWAHLAAAEGSDWFWWYGPEFHTPFALFFDALFRAHLRAVWTALDQPWPDALRAPLGGGVDRSAASAVLRNVHSDGAMARGQTLADASEGLEEESG